jgi:hypothetical protein
MNQWSSAVTATAATGTPTRSGKGKGNSRKGTSVNGNNNNNGNGTGTGTGAQISGSLHHCLRLDRRITCMDITIDGRYLVVSATRVALVFDNFDTLRPPLAQLNRRGASYNVAHKQVLPLHIVSMDGLIDGNDIMGMNDRIFVWFALLILMMLH